MKFTKVNCVYQLNCVRILFGFICLFSPNFSKSQAQDSHFLDPSDRILSQITAQYEKQLSAYRDQGVDISIYEKIYKIRAENIEKAFREHSFFYDSLIDEAVQNSLQAISKSNEKIVATDYTILVNNSPIANAYSIGGGTIILSLGILRKIRNQGELAFILAHEIGHDYRQDVDITSYRKLERLNSNEFKKEIDRIEKEKYNRKEKLETFFSTLFLMEMKFSRKQEIAADSMAMLLTLNAKYEHRHAFTTLNLLDSLDLYKFPDINYLNLLGFADYPFKERWIADKSSVFSMSAEQADEDALKSHPDIADRLSKLQLLIKDQIDTARGYVDHKELGDFKSALDLDLAFIDSWEANNNYGKALFFSLKQLQEQPGNKEVLMRISSLFDKIYEAQKSHELSKFVQSPGPHLEASYKKFLTLLSRIRLTELELMIYHFHKKYSHLLQEDEDFLRRLNKYKLIIR